MFLFHNPRALLGTGTGIETAGISIVIEEEEEEIGEERQSTEGGAMAGQVIKVRMEQRRKRLGDEDMESNRKRERET